MLACGNARIANILTQARSEGLFAANFVEASGLLHVESGIPEYLAMYNGPHPQPALTYLIGEESLNVPRSRLLSS